MTDACPRVLSKQVFPASATRDRLGRTESADRQAGVARGEQTPLPRPIASKDLPPEGRRRLSRRTTTLNCRDFVHASHINSFRRFFYRRCKNKEFVPRFKFVHT